MTSNQWSLQKLKLYVKETAFDYLEEIHIFV